MKVRRTPRKLITATRAAEIIGYRSGVTVKRLMQDKKLTGYRIGQGRTSPWVFSEREVLDYRESVIHER